MDHRAGAGDGVAGGEHAVRRRAARVVVGLDGVPGRQRHLFTRVAELGHVRDGRDHGRRRHLEARVAHVAGAALVPLEAHALDGAGPAGLAETDLLGGDVELDLDALLEGGGEVAGAGLEVFGIVRGEHGDGLGAQTAGGARRVEGGGPAADDGDRVADADLLALAHLAQQVEAVDGGFGAAQLGGRLLPRAHADEHGVEAGVEQALEGDLEAQGGVVDEADAGLPQGLELAVEHLLGQAELGDAVAQRAARLLVGVVEGDLVTALGEVPGGGETGRPGADDGDPPAGRHTRDQRRRRCGRRRRGAGRRSRWGRRPRRAGSPARSSAGRRGRGCRGRAGPRGRCSRRRPRRRPRAPSCRRGCRCGSGRRASRAPRSSCRGRTGTS